MLRDIGLRRTRTYCGALNVRGVCARHQHLFDEARQFYTEAISLGEPLGVSDAANARSNLAELQFQAGEPERALALAIEADRICRTERSPDLTGSPINIAAYLLALRRVDEAWRVAREALTLAQRQQMTSELSWAIQHLATVAALRDNPRRGERLLGYVDAWLNREGYEREYTERRTYEILQTALRANLSKAEKESLAAQGATLSEDNAVAEALMV